MTRSSSRCIATAAVALLGGTTPVHLSGQTAAPAAPRSAAIGDVRYDVLVDQARVLRRVIGVRMRFTIDGTDPVLLSMPAWTPGDYTIANYARFVTGFRAMSGTTPLSWDKLDHDTWRVFPNGAKEATITFDASAETLDNGSSWTAGNFAFFNGTNLFLYPEGRPLEFPSTVTVATDPSWLVATGMTPAPRTTTSATTARSFTSANYHELVDMPFFVGRFDLDSMRIANVWFRLASYPSGSLSSAERRRVWDVFQKLIPPQVAMFGEVPFQTYTVLQVADSSYPGIAGLEHANSHLDILTPNARVHPIMFSIYSHEFVHAWNVKRLRPMEMWPYDYSRPQPSPWLWVSEGITDYHGDLAMVRGGVWSRRDFYEATAEKINSVHEAVPVALEDASLSAWVKPVDGTESLYYDKGAVAGLLLDILIRDASNNAGSLDAAIRDLYRSTYKQGRGFNGGDFWGAITKAAAGRAFTDFHAKYVDGREPFPYEAVLPLAGIRIIGDTIREARLGVTTVIDSGGIRVVAVDPAMSAGQAGVREGDYLLAIGDIAVEDQAFGTKFRAQFGGRPDAPLPIRVRRAGAERVLNGRVQLVSRVIWRLAEDPAASPKARLIRESMLTGK